MAGKYRERLTFSNVVSVISLLFALGLGSAWAATELSKNEVKSKHIGKGQVKNRDLGKNSVTSPKVANGSLLGEDFAVGQLPQGPQGPQGEQGVQGERGLQGEPGTARAYGHVTSHAGSPCSPNCRLGQSRGISQVTRIGEGNYCVRVPGVSSGPGTSFPAVADVDEGGTGGNPGDAEAMPTTTDSGCGTDFQVKTLVQPSIAVRNAADNGSETVSDTAVPSDGISFTIIVP